MQEIDLKTAVKLAKDFAEDVLGSENIQDLGLEAIEKTEGGARWLITLGFSRPWDRPKKRSRWQQTVIEDLMPVYEPPLQREYKTFLVDAATGHVEGMRMVEAS